MSEVSKLAQLLEEGDPLRHEGGLSPADDAVMCAGIAMASKTAPDGAHATANAHDSAGILLHGASVLGWHCQRHAAFGKPLWQG